MSALTVVPSAIRVQRQARAARARAESRARFKARTEPLILFVITTAALTALGVRDTVQLHLIYPEALTRLAHAYIAWWNSPPRFRAVGFVYPPLQTVALLPFALLRPLATSLVALPLFSALCAGVTVATLDRTLVVLDLAWWIRAPLLLVFAANPLFLDYGANGTATCLEMALLAAALHNFCAWYVKGANSIRSLAFSGVWLSFAFLARYESVLWLALIVLAVPVVRLRRGASLIEVLALEAIVLAPLVYIFLVWSGVSSLVGGGGFLSWITRAGAGHVSGLNFGGRMTFGARSSGVLEVLWRTSPLLLIVPGLLLLGSLLLRRPILAIVAGTVLVGAAVSVIRMALAPNAQLLQPAYQMVALVPMLIGAGWVISLFPRQRSVTAQSVRAMAALAVLAGLLVSLATAYTLMQHDNNQYDRGFTFALSSHLKRVTPASGAALVDNPGRLYADNKALATFFQAAVYSQKTVLVDELAFPGLVLAEDTTTPYRTRAENGDAFWERLLSNPRGPGKLQYLVVGNPQLTVPGYPRDAITARYPTAYAGQFPHSQVIYRNPLVAVVELLPRITVQSALLPRQYGEVLKLYQDLPELSPRPHFRIINR